MSGDVDYEAANIESVAAHLEGDGRNSEAARIIRRQHAEITRLRAEMARKVPEGWQVVPKVATDAMQNAATGDLYHHQDGMAWVDAERAWAAMLTAAPAPSDGGDNG